MRKKRKKKVLIRDKEEKRGRLIELEPEIRNNIIAISLLALALILILSFFNLAGPWGKVIFRAFDYLLGWGYFILPLLLFIISFSFFHSSTQKIKFHFLSLLGMLLILLSSLSILEIFLPKRGGFIGKGGVILLHVFGFWASLIIALAVLASGFVLAFNSPLRWPWRRKKGISISSIPFRKQEEEEENQNQEDEEEQKEYQYEGGEEIKEDDKKQNAKQKETELGEGAVNEEKELSSETVNPLVRLKSNYKLPPLSLLDKGGAAPRGGDIRANANIIKRTLESFGIEVEMGEVNVGPTVTQYTLRPREGIKLANITSLQNDLALALAAHPLRMEAPIPGKSLVGIEIPNKSIALVRLGNLLREVNFKKYLSTLVFPLGRDVKGTVVLADLAKMPHLLIAGATGAGKSVCIHSLISSLLFENSPETLRFILIDPKRVELSHYEGIAHLLTPVIVDTKKVVPALRWAIHEMERRYNLLSDYRVRDIKGFNIKAKSKGKPILPYIVIVIDELADLMMTYGRDLESLIIRIAQMARATGIHLVISTQRPSVEVITGLIKANITSRVAFQVASQVDSRTILDMGGAEKLLGHGDMLYLSPNSSRPRRIQGSFVSEQEIDHLVDFIIKHFEGQNNGSESDLEGFINHTESPSSNNKINFDEWEEQDELYPEAYKTVVKAGKASASLLQRKLRIGYARAARLLDVLEERGVVGPVDGAKPREVFVKNQDNNQNG